MVMNSLSDAKHLILLVEDNPVDIDLTKRAFVKNNLPVQFMLARDGQEAIDYIARWEKNEPSPRLILLDLKLPRVSGLEFLSTIKSHPVYRSLPVIVLTSSRELRDIRDAYHLGANSYLVKPIDFDDFINLAVMIETYWCSLNTTPVY